MSKVDETKKANKAEKEYDFTFKRAPSWYTLNSILRRKSCCEKLLFLHKNLLKRMKQGRGPQ